MGVKKSRLSKFTEAVRLLFTRFCASFFTLSFSLSFSGVAANSLSQSLSLKQDKEVLVRIVKDAQRTKKAGSDGTFNEFVEKHAQTEKLKHTHDPNRHDWKTLVKFVESVLGKEEEEERKNENDDEEEDGEIEKEKTKTNATKTTSE
jgi:hypothetical protein